MILADSTVVIDFCRRRPDPKVISVMAAHVAAICGITRAEVLTGARDLNHHQQLLGMLAQFQSVPIPESMWDLVGENIADLRRNGITVPFQDAIIATVAIANDIELWTRDNQFRMIQGVLPQLRLFQEPP